MAAIAVFAALASFAAAEADAVAAQRPAMAAKSGGVIAKPGSSKGRIVFVNTQGDMSVSNIYMAVKSLGDVLARFPVEVVESSPAKAGELKARFKADVAIVVAAENDSPALLAAPDENWAVVNVRALLRNLKTDAAKAKFYEARCRKEIMRGFVCAAGGVGSSFPGNIMNVVKVEDLDLCEEFIPFDKVGVVKQHLRDCGITPTRFATYRMACREGWAPAPTNEYQKAIWDKVHQLPTEPIKIKPETKKVSQ
jgi:hypothetical protein